ncbi:MAG: hypothetical protein CME62_04350 [Halobacteriovoraceae bacterium]|nr:hypothetical protein [Halobacteriovoraceae bacterium]|tara:strand:+ start:13281 stop:14279 length:999 start_codon:yes stop_codon:yes gene_type:complete
MQTYSLKFRNIFSTWLNLFFFLLLGSYLVYIEFFQDTQINLDKSNLLSSPLQKEFMSNVDKVTFKNRIGSFSIFKDKGDWFMETPKNIPAKRKTIDIILQELSNIGISTIHEYEKINIKSFSLDRPVIEIDLTSSESDETLKVTFGILNRIDNTTYMTVTDKNIIYQVKLFRNPLESYELSDFIDSNVFSMESDQVKRISLYAGKESSPRNVLEFNGANWISKKYRTISNENTQEKVQEILDIKTHMIIDETNDELQNFIANYLSSPLYRINVITQDDKSVNYVVSTLTKSITELKIPKRQYFIMTASDRPYPFLIAKKYLDRFIIRYSHLR